MRKEPEREDSEVRRCRRARSRRSDHPAEAALELTVEGDACTTTESYEVERDGLEMSFPEAAQGMIPEVKKQLPDNEADFELITVRRR